MSNLQALQMAIHAADAEEKAAFTVVEAREAAFEDACVAYAIAREKSNAARSALFEAITAGAPEIDVVRAQRYGNIARSVCR